MATRQALYETYVTSMEQAVAQKRVCWRIIGCRHDKFPGRWEIVLGTGRSLGPWDLASAAMAAAIRENRALMGYPSPQEESD